MKELTIKITSFLKESISDNEIILGYHIDDYMKKRDEYLTISKTLETYKLFYGQLDLFDKEIIDLLKRKQELSIFIKSQETIYSQIRILENMKYDYQNIKKKEYGGE